MHQNFHPQSIFTVDFYETYLSKLPEDYEDKFSVGLSISEVASSGLQVLIETIRQANLFCFENDISGLVSEICYLEFCHFTDSPGYSASIS
jgi:hypothetical protein